MIAMTTIALLAAAGAVMCFVPAPSEGAEPADQVTVEATKIAARPARRPIPSVDSYAGEDQAEEQSSITPEELEEFDRRHRERQAKRRALKRFAWESPSDTRARLWNVPQDEHDEATATAFMRVCFSEADGYESDCLGIWKVFENTRSRSCSRNITKITECDENGETMLSIMKRHSGTVLGVYSPRTKRSVWISNLELDCEPPRAWPGTERDWRTKGAPIIGRDFFFF